MSTLAAKLVAKDLRLSLDMLLPWGLIVGGTALVGLALTRLPSTMLPETMGQLSVSSILFMVGMLAAATCVVAAAWLAAVVAQGDRIHGAEHLVAALPIAPWRRGAAKLLVIALVAAVPVVVSLAMLVAGAVTDPRPDGVRLAVELWDLDGPLAFVVGASIAGAGLSLGVSPLVRGPFRVVAVALLLGIAGGVVGFVASSLSFDRVAGGLVEFWHSRVTVSDELERTYLPQARERAGVIAAGTGVGAVALVALVVGAVALTRTGRAPRAMAILGLAIVLAGVAGAGATVVAFRTDPWLPITGAWNCWMADSASDDELMAALSREVDGRNANRGVSMLDSAKVGAIPGRLARWSPEERARAPLMAAVLAAQDDPTKNGAIRAVGLLPPGPERTAHLLRLVPRYPDTIEWILVYLTEGIPTDPADSEPWRHAMTQAEQRMAMDTMRARKLRVLQERYPVHRDEIQAIIDGLGKSQGR